MTDNVIYLELYEVFSTELGPSVLPLTCTQMSPSYYRTRAILTTKNRTVRQRIMYALHIGEQCRRSYILCLSSLVNKKNKHMRTKAHWL